MFLTEENFPQLGEPNPLLGILQVYELLAFLIGWL